MSQLHVPRLAQQGAAALAAALGTLTASGALGQNTPAAAQPATGAPPAEQATPPEAAQLRFRMDEIVVTATRSPRKLFDAPYLVDVVGAQQLRQRSYRSTPEALLDVPGVMVQKTSHGQGSPFIRGFTGFRNVFLIDGIRLNNSVFRDGPNQYWNTVDPLSLDRLEVVKGPASTLYGSDAIGGAVAAYTISPYASGEGFQAAGSLFYRFSSAERSHVGRVEGSVGQGDVFGAVVGLSLKHFGDLQAGDPTRRQPNTGYNEIDVDFKTRIRLTELATLIVAHQTVQQNNVPRTHRTRFAKSFHGTTIGSDRRRDLDQERNLTYAQLVAQDMDGPVQSMRLNLSWQRQRETRDRIRSSGSRDFQGFEVDTIGLWGRFTSQTPVGELTYGAEWYHDNVNSFSSRNPIQGPVGDDATYDLVGLYLQDAVALGERTEAILGGRFDYARADAASVQDPATGKRIGVSDDWTSLVGNLRVRHSFVPDRLQVFAGLSQGFRAPNLSDLTRLDSARTNEIETPAPGLDPERFLQYEVGVKTQGSWWSAQASYFYTDIDDLIVRTPTGRQIDGENEVTKRNSGDGFVQGVELGGRLQLHPQWTLFGQLAWVEGEVDTFPTSQANKRREPLDRLAPLMGEIGLRYDEPDGTFWVEGLVRLADKADRLSTRDKADTSRIPPGGTPGYAVVSVRGGVRLAQNVDLTLALENIGDVDYRIHGSGQNEPGRNFVVSVEFTF